ncbi:N-alpha-acetyltransferase 30-like isoform X1 [Amphibalanus amphitrite]|uniref:N-alpha-acetyltransferase 30-like isoform X1 n=1 Tax=Amphibalanus amphitrite TaxID=1232801 RepID=UPI001C9208C0|nr:N-alpha-acetyltransferase 30-like isoform X1 [Amphibalanus amphitrite]XP_043209648.1 N-alpha-acetyltransferase 30-like isoform X1 [Amphibalanus amphitrite]XP_043209649.1 N-alpha-acetyltransferase 30-like isoform X1 [Amphibalanus amphitrite]XP_043209650.1 N-alpha-acetyltransferase 30-like isoform X1 [Amphibalanus amphitrite]XP_043209651.1 N-alpha-acetyltransferase 30-like isoform X1 [Amphibalanus amphitrite]XP_043209652.1 N-alpha-acetyltransferase 30-like isoform X1 [Amphibalanus amphitrite]
MEASTEEPGPDSDLAANKQGHDKSTEGVADQRLCVTSSASTEAVNPSPIRTAPAPDTMPAGESAAPTSDPSPTNHKDQEGDSKAAPSAELANCSLDDEPIVYSNYESELQMPEIMRLIQKDLSEPYSIYTYRYFINNWPNLCFLARHAGRIVGAIVCKLDSHDSHTKRAVTSRGYIAMLAVDQQFRKRRIGEWLLSGAERHPCHGRRCRRRGGAGDGGDQQGRAATVREPGLCARQASVSLLPERRGRAAAQTVAVAALAGPRRPSCCQERPLKGYWVVGRGWVVAITAHRLRTLRSSAEW